MHNFNINIKEGNMEIRSFGVGRRIKECERLLGTVADRYSGRLILLPIPTTRDNIYINGTDMTLTSLLHSIDFGSIVAGYNIPKLIKEGTERLGGRVIDAYLDEEFLLKNAIISARGALGYLLTSLPREISRLRIGVIGYGRIGRELSGLLLLLGSKVTVFTTTRDVAIELGESGVDSVLIDGLICPEGFDVIINTAPKRLLDEKSLDEKTEILDLASGNIFEPSKRLTKLSSIPDSMYPITAGRLYFEAILRGLEVEK